MFAQNITTTLYITYIIIGITALVSFYAFQAPAILSAFMMNPYAVEEKKEYYRFLTSGFIHKDHMHLLWNMFSLYFFGPAIEREFYSLFGSVGSVYFIALYLLAIIFSDVPTFFKHKANVRYNSLGASGGVAAIIFAFIIFQPLELICIFIALCVPGFILGVLYLVYSWYQGKKSRDNINHDAHLYGALFGFIFCIVVAPSSIGNFIEQIRNWNVFGG
jgi:membrane associated rhomboid family serine protease